jgi:integrase
MTAVRRHHRAAASVESEFERARAGLGQAVDLTLIAPMTDGSGFSTPTIPVKATVETAAVASVRSISEVYDRFIADPRFTWSTRTTIAHATTRKWVFETFGPETAISAISRERCREFVDLLRHMPSHADKRYPGMGIREAVAAAKVNGKTRLINAANVNAYLNRFGGLLNWAVDEGYIERNPVKGLKLTDPVRRRDKRNPFSTEQLRQIFDAPIYRGCEDDERGYAQIGDKKPRRARFWVPLIALFSGMRLNEICQLEVGDIQQIDGVPCFQIASGTSQTGEQKSVKTLASERIVPVHQQLVQFGFMAFVDSMRLRGESSLFPEIPPGRLGYRSVSFSKWFSRFLCAAGATARLTCFHSFRHNFRDGLRDAKVDRDIALVLGGWTVERSSIVADN